MKNQENFRVLLKENVELFSTHLARSGCCIFLGEVPAELRSSLLYSDVVDTEVLGAAQTQEPAWLYQHGALCRLISPAKKLDY